MLKDMEVKFFDMMTPEENAQGTHYEGGPKPSKTILRKGHVKPGEGMHGSRPLPCDMHFDRDVIVTMRDGTKIYVDVFRPVTEEMVPAILPWSPYGKTGTGEMTYDRTGPYNCGIDPQSLSGYHKFEASDPAEWAARGYATINVDARGAFDSDGHMMRWGPQEALDVYDTIEWIVQQPWCNGAVGMSGNSWLAVSQINVAARCPHPALKCIAPWEGHSDHYNDVMVRGGIPQVAFGNWMQKTLVGRNKMEDTAGMARAHPYFDKYWQIKAIPVENIDIPTYTLASYSSFIHTAGSLRTWRRAKTQKKWIRFHNAQEWADLYKRCAPDIERSMTFASH
jgi:predicted acyl esterase